MALLDEVKADLGISSTTRNTGISTAIASAKQKMQMMGVQHLDEDDEHTKQAIMLYVRYWLNFQGDGERYLQHFNDFVNGIALSGDYR